MLVWPSSPPVASCPWVLPWALPQGRLRVAGPSLVDGLMLLPELVPLSVWLSGMHPLNPRLTWSLSPPRRAAAQFQTPLPRLLVSSSVAKALLDPTHPVQHHGPSQAVLSFALWSRMAPPSALPVLRLVLLHPPALIVEEPFAVALVSSAPHQARQLPRKLVVSGLALVLTRAQTRSRPSWTRRRDDRVSSLGSGCLAPKCKLDQFCNPDVGDAPWQYGLG